MICPLCNSEMELKSSDFRYADGSQRKFYGCSRWPKCRATHGAHSDGRPLGFPANKETKLWRMRAHIEFDRLWKSGEMSRNKAYCVMRELMGMTEDEAHIAKFNSEQCRKLVTEVLKYRSKNVNNTTVINYDTEKEIK